MLESQIHYIPENEVKTRPILKKERYESVLKSIVHGIENAIVNHYRHKYDKLKSEGRWEEYKYNLAYNVYGRWLPKIAKIANHINIVGNEENIPKIGNTGFILISNHKNTLDPFYITCALKVGNYVRKARWISKYENSLGIVGVIAEPIDTIFLSPDRRWTIEGRQKTIETLLKKEGVCICPEGTRVKNEKLSRFKTGAAELCLEYNVPYVPTAIVGKPVPFKGRVEIRVNKPVFLDKNVLESYRSASNENKARMSRVLADDMREQVKALLENRSVPKAEYEK